MMKIIAIIYCILSLFPEFKCLLIYNPEPVSFQYMIYNGLLVKNKTRYLISEIDDCPNDKSCLSECNSQSGCMYAYFYSTSTCLLCNNTADLFMNKIVTSKGVSTYLYKKLISESVNSLGLAHNWPICGGTLRDTINGANLIDAVSTSFTEDRFGISNNALLLSNGSISLPPSNYFSGNFTFMLWTKAPAPISGEAIIDCGNGMGAAAVDTVALYYPTTATGTITLTTTITLISSPTPTTNEWHHIALTYDQSTFILYVDGLNVGSNSYSPGPANVTRQNCYLGRSHNYPSVKDANAAFGEIKIFNRPLSQDEIVQEMQPGETCSSNMESTCIKNPNFVFTDGLVNYWPFCGSANDIIGLANLYGGTNVEYVPDRFSNPNGAVWLNVGYFKIPPGNYFQTSSFTIAGWVVLNEYNSYPEIIDFGTGSPPDNTIDITIGHNSSGGGIFAEIVSPSCISPSPCKVSTSFTLTLDQWYYLSFVYGNNMVSLYLNGYLISPSPVRISTLNASVMRYWNHFGRSTWYPGHDDSNATMQDFKIFNRALNSTEIIFEMQNEYFYTLDLNSVCTKSSTFTLTPGLTNYWPFCGNANDVIGSAHLFGGTNSTFVPDRFDKPQAAVYLDNGYYMAPSQVYFSTASLVVMAWVKIMSITKLARLIDFGQVNGDENVMFKLCTTATKPEFAIYLPSSSNGSYFQNNIAINNWTHVAVSINNTNGSFYINGNLDSTNLLFNVPSNVVRTSNFVGGYNYADANANAMIDELKFFNRALTQSEIKTEMDNSFY